MPSFTVQTWALSGEWNPRTVGKTWPSLGLALRAAQCITLRPFQAVAVVDDGDRRYWQTNRYRSQVETIRGRRGRPMTFDVAERPKHHRVVKR